MLDGSQNRGGVVLRAVDDQVDGQPRGDDQSRNPGAGAPLIVRTSDAALAGRGHVVPLPAELVIGHHDHRVLAAGAALKIREQVNEVTTATALARVARMLVLEPDRLHEAHSIEL